MQPENPTDPTHDLSGPEAGAELAAQIFTSPNWVAIYDAPINPALLPAQEAAQVLARMAATGYDPTKPTKQLACSSPEDAARLCVEMVFNTPPAMRPYIQAAIKAVMTAKTMPRPVELGGMGFDFGAAPNPVTN